MFGPQRINRKRWWLWALAGAVGYLATVFLCAVIGNVPLLTAALWGGGVAYGTFQWNLDVRRYHDLGKSGWRTMANLVPIVGFYLIVVECGFEKSDPNENQWGAPRT